MPGDASRQNGRKGGRPRKNREAPPVVSQTPPPAPSTPAVPPVPATALAPATRLDLSAFHLSRREEQFLFELFADPAMNQTQAYKRAGYKVKTDNGASVCAARMLAKVRVAQAYAAILDWRRSANEVTAQRVISELARIAFGDIRNIFNERGNLKLPGQLSDEAAAAIAGIEVVTKATGDEDNPVEYVHKIKTSDKVRALELLGKHLGILKDQVEVTNRVPLFALPADARPDVSGAGM